MPPSLKLRARVSKASAAFVGNQPRQANVAKLCGNFLIGAAVGAMAEVSGILDGENADTDAFMALMTETLFSAPIYKNYAPSVTGARPLPAAGLSPPIKDMDLLAAVSTKNQLDGRPLTAFAIACHRRWRWALKRMIGRWDWDVQLASDSSIDGTVITVTCHRGDRTLSGLSGWLHVRRS